MPEYRRFVAYFYEYINGKKEKNAGFAKVELRNGIWRVLFRLTTEISPQQPVQVYGFVRTKGYLLAIPLGTMRTGQPLMEEWAYRAEYRFDTGRYSFADLSGVRIQSGDHRNFITVWDDEPMELDRFVLELPEQSGETENDTDIGEKSKAENNDDSDVWEKIETPKNDTEPVVQEKIQESEEKSAARKPISAAEVEETETKEAEAEEAETLDGIHASENGCMELFAERQKFFPFSDDEIQDCVQIMPCDIVRLQQKDWQVGRSSFLQHGFYQYRHLMLGKQKDGTYVIGVPGIQNQQENVMAQMCGFEHFKGSRTFGCGKTFGYWWKVLIRKQETV